MHRAIAAAAIVASLGWDRLILALAVIAASTALAITGKVDPAAPIALMTAMMGYVFGASSPATTQAAHEVVTADQGTTGGVQAP